MLKITGIQLKMRERSFHRLEHQLRLNQDS